MPPLDIIDDDGNLKQLAPIVVGAVMLSPTDEKWREEIYATGYLATATKVEQGIPAKIGAVIDSGPGNPWTISSRADPCARPIILPKPSAGIIENKTPENSPIGVVPRKTSPLNVPV